MDTVKLQEYISNKGLRRSEAREILTALLSGMNTDCFSAVALCDLALEYDISKPTVYSFLKLCVRAKVISTTPQYKICA